MPKETMTPRERWLAVLRHEKPDRIPMDYAATQEATDKLLKHLGCSHAEMLERLHIDAPVWVGGRYVGPPLAPDVDVFGIRHALISYDGGVYDERVSAPLAVYQSVDEIQANHTFPSPDHWDYSHLPAEVEGCDDRPIRGGGSEPFLIYKALRGEEQAFVDLIEHRDIVDYVLDQLFELAYQNTLRIFETIPGKVTITYVAEDLGGQDALMYSPGIIREVFLPRMKRIMDLTREHGGFVFTHSDGAVRSIIPDLIATGTQVLDPVQWVCRGMEREALKRDFGEHLAFTARWTTSGPCRSGRSTT